MRIWISRLNLRWEIDYCDFWSEQVSFFRNSLAADPPLSRDSFWNVMFCVGIVPEKWSAEQKINWLELNLSNQFIRESDYTRGINSLKYIFGRHWFSDHTLSIDITFLANMIVTRSKCVQVAHCQSCLHQLASSSRKPVGTSNRVRRVYVAKDSCIRMLRAPRKQLSQRMAGPDLPLARWSFWNEVICEGFVWAKSSAEQIISQVEWYIVQWIFTRLASFIHMQTAVKCSCSTGFLGIRLAVVVKIARVCDWLNL